MTQGLARGSRVAEHHMGPQPSNPATASDVARGKGNELLSEGGFSRGDLVLHSEGGENIPSAGLTGLPIPVILS